MQITRTLAALFAAAAVTSFGDVVFEENFRNYKDTVPGITEAEGLELINEPVWYRAAWLVVKPKASFPLFKEGIRLPAGNRFDLLVDVSFESPAAPAEASYFDLALANKGGKTQAVRIAADAIGGAKIDRLGNGQWVELAVKADGANADIYISKAHDFTKVASVKLADTFDTLNFAVTAEKGFSLRNLVVRTPEALPDYSAASHFAAFKSLTQPLEGAKVAASNETLRGAPEIHCLTYLYNCTVTGNTGLGVRGVIASNTISWGNETTDTFDAATNCCSSVLTAATKYPGCIARDPRLTADYRPGAAVRNKGLYFSWMDDEVDPRSKDLAGNPRLQGDAPDLGCYEPIPLGLMLLVK